jgi:hypothetical protein
MARPAGRALLLLGCASAIAACSLVFHADDLSSGQPPVDGAGGAGAGAGAGGAGGGSDAGCAGGEPTPEAGPCATDADCDDGNPCTADLCEPDGCEHQPMTGATCGKGTDCTPAPVCTASDACAPGLPDAAKCDDGNPCTIDACEVTGCTHSANTGAPCNDGDACDGAGTCDGSGTCEASPVAPTGACVNNSCPGGYYFSAYSCNPLCGSCPLCVNYQTCTFACTPQLTACCGNDCGTACPAGYQQVGASFKTATCGCTAAAPGDTVTCSR